MFIEKLIESIKEKKSVVCMGLDPRLENEGEIPKYLINELEDPNQIILEFNKTLIDNTHDLIPIIKPQIAFYEKYEAYNALKETIIYAHKKDLLVILDCKRNDIGSTSAAYASSIFNVYKADACTLNAYLGIDSITPFMKYEDKGLFILVKTSNPSSNDFQNIFSTRMENISERSHEIKVKDVILKRNYIIMADLVEKWSKDLASFSNYNNLGVVVGATFPHELKLIRDIIKKSFILIPGFGAQGAQANDIKYGFDDNGLGGIVNSSRGIIFAYNRLDGFTPDKFGEAARAEIMEMSSKINSVI